MFKFKNSKEEYIRNIERIRLNNVNLKIRLKSHNKRKFTILLLLNDWNIKKKLS